MAGPAVTTRGRDRAGALFAASSGINGLRGGVGINASAAFVRGQSTGTLGVEAFRLWRGETGSGLRPYLRGGLGLVELGRSDGDLVLGSMSPRAELGLMWLTERLRALTLSATAEYRPRGDGLSTPIYCLQLGFGEFDYLGSPSDASRGAGPSER